MDTLEFMADCKLKDEEAKLTGEKVWSSCKVRVVPNLSLNNANTFLEWIYDIFNLEDISSITLSAK